MVESRQPVHTGGCQCGAIRYAQIRNTCHQHPDHDTPAWPMQEPSQ